MIFPEPVLVSRVFPHYLGKAIQNDYLERGVAILAGEKPASFSKTGNRFVTRTESGKEIQSDIVVVGIGIALSLDLPRRAGLQTANGIIVDSYLQASIPDIYAAGDNTFFPYQAL